LGCGNDNTSADLSITGKQAKKHSYHKKCIPIAFICLPGSDKISDISQFVDKFELCFLFQWMTSLTFSWTVALLHPASIWMEGQSIHTPSRFSSEQYLVTCSGGDILYWSKAIDQSQQNSE